MGIACWARPELGHAASTPPKKLMTSRRRMDRPHQVDDHTLAHQLNTAGLCCAAQYSLPFMYALEFGLPSVNVAAGHEQTSHPLHSPRELM
jgi:hypothetical protein